jgi:general secretion pathway protein L
MRSIGIDIGTLSVKVADVEMAGKALVLRDFLEIPYSLDISQDKHIQILSSITRIAQSYDPHHTRFVMGISQDRVSIRQKIFPFREKVKILKSLPFELEDEIPFDQDKAVFDAKILKHRGSTSEVLACATPNKYIEDLIKLSNEGGIDPDVISTDGFALSNLFTNWWSAPPEADTLPQSAGADLYLHLGHSKTILMIIQNNYLLETRSIQMGGLEIVKAIQKTYQISFAEALKGLQEKGFVLTKNDGATKDQITFSTAIVKALNPLISEIKKTLVEIESDLSVSIQNVQLMGGVSHLVNIAPYMSQKLGLICTPLNHLTSGIKVYASQTNELLKDSAIAIGLAIEGLKKPKNPAINFRKGAFARSGANATAFWTKWKKTVQYATALLVLFMVYSYSREMMATSLAEKATEALSSVAKSPSVGLKGPQARPDAITKFIREKKKEISDHQKLQELQVINSPLEIINKISSSLPQRKTLPVDIRQFSVRSEFVELQGEVSSQDQLNTMKSLFRNLATDKKLQDLPPSIQSKDGRLVFHMSFKMDRKVK